MTGALRLYAEDHPALSHKLKARLEKAKQDRISELSLAQDWSDFKERRGVINGIDQAIAVCDEIEHQLNRD